MSRRFFPDSCVEVDPIGDQDAFSCEDAEVWMEGAAILVSYFDDDGIVVLEGIREEGSEYALTARSRPRRATLLPVAESDGVPEAAARSFAGTVSEGTETARWKLVLGSEVAEDVNVDPA